MPCTFLRTALHTRTLTAASQCFHPSSLALHHQTEREVRRNQTSLSSTSRLSRHSTIAHQTGSSFLRGFSSSTTAYTATAGASNNPVPGPADDEEHDSHLSSLFKASSIQYPDDDAEMRSLIEDAQKKNRLAVIDWSASWCPPCRAIAPLYEKLSKQPENKHVTFIKADIEDLPDASYEAGVESVPTFHFIKNNQLVAAFSGADAEKLQQLIQEHR